MRKIFVLSEKFKRIVTTENNCDPSTNHMLNMLFMNLVFYRFAYIFEAESKYYRTQKCKQKNYLTMLDRWSFDSKQNSSHTTITRHLKVVQF